MTKCLVPGRVLVEGLVALNERFSECSPVFDSGQTSRLPAYVTFDRKNVIILTLSCRLTKMALQGHGSGPTLEKRHRLP